jgi:hypothetical protein
MKRSSWISAAFIELFFMVFISAALAQDVPEMAPSEPAGSGQELLLEAAVAPTPWGVPVLVSPEDMTYLYHYPRATTLAWKPMTGATSYKVYREYLSGSVWVAYPTVTVTGINNTSYTFNFVGDQTCRWRVVAFNGTTPSTTSVWRRFMYQTKPQMPTPILTNPGAEEVFSNFPRSMTLSWKMIPAAVGYKVERSYCLADRVTCTDYAPIVINDPLKSYYTFNFVGAQPGKWRVTALGAPTYRDSAPSNWRWFTFDK